MSEQKPKCYIVSWYHNHDDEFEYHGPWWVSGETMGGQQIIRAAVMATSEYQAKMVIRSSYDKWPESVDWRLCEEGEPQFGERFPKADWMQWPWPEPAGEPKGASR